MNSPAAAPPSVASHAVDAATGPWWMGCWTSAAPTGTSSPSG